MNSYDELHSQLNGCRALINVASIGFGSAKNIIKSCYKSNIERVIFISTTAIFTRLNASSKTIRLEAENDIINSKLKWTIIRPTMIYGSPKDRNMIKLIKWIDNMPIIPIFGNGKSLQQPVNVKDVAWSLVKIIDKKSTYYRSFNISGKEPLTFTQIVDIIEKMLNKSIIKIYLSKNITLLFIGLLERLRIKFPIKSEQVHRLNENKDFIHEKAKRAFNYNPLSFEEGINIEIESYHNKSWE